MPDETRETRAGGTQASSSGVHAGATSDDDRPREAGAATEAPVQTLSWNQPARALETAPRAVRRLGEQRSLFGEILDWMLAPLLLLWPLSMTITYVVAQNIANAPFDRVPGTKCRSAGQSPARRACEVTLQLPLPAARSAAGRSTRCSHVQDHRRRRAAGGGDAELPSPASDEAITPGKVRLRDDMAHGNDVRVAFSWVHPPGPTGQATLVLVQVAEVLDKRAQLANEIIRV